jgi:hypothetical protein
MVIGYITDFIAAITPPKKTFRITNPDQNQMATALLYQPMFADNSQTSLLLRERATSVQDNRKRYQNRHSN